MAVFPGNLLEKASSTSSSTSSPPPSSSPRSSEQVALGGEAPVLIGHDQGPALPQLIERRDRAISRAARLTVLIALNVPLEGG